MMNTRVVTRPSLSPKTISRSQSPRCGCCSLICSTGIGSPFLAVICLSYEYKGAKARGQAEPYDSACLCDSASHVSKRGNEPDPKTGVLERQGAIGWGRQSRFGRVSRLAEIASIGKHSF